MAHSTLVSTDALAAHLDDAAWVVIDCRYDLTKQNWGEEQYAASHVPGAVYASLGHDLSGVKDGRNGRHPLPSPDAMNATFGRLGIGPGMQVVVYDQDNGIYASRLWWMLRYMGHDAAAVLDGGFAKWAREARPTRAGVETRAPAPFAGKPRSEMRLTANQVWTRLDDPTMMLVDARAPERFEGRGETLDRTAGHIPGARNHFYKTNVAADDVRCCRPRFSVRTSTGLSATRQRHT